MAIWDHPANNAGGFGSSKIRTFSADSVKCPNCASNLVFESSHGAMICRNCGGLFDPETLDKVGSFGLVNPEKDYDGTIKVSKDDEGRVEIVCNSCGAQIIADKNVSSTICSFCGSPAFVTVPVSTAFSGRFGIRAPRTKSRCVLIP